MSETREEVEQIVDDFAATSMLLWDGEDAAMPEQIAKRDRLVAALTAAINVDYELNIDGHIDCTCPKCELRYILSVLRAQDVEGT